MGPVRKLALLAAAVAAHMVGVWLFPGLPRFLDLFLVAVALNALRGSTVSGFVGGTIAGLLHDALSGGLYGLHGFADTIIGYAVARASQKLVFERLTAVAGVVALASLVQQLVLVGLATQLLPAAELPRPLWVVVKAVVSGLAAAGLMLATDTLRQARERRRRGRAGRIRFGS